MRRLSFTPAVCIAAITVLLIGCTDGNRAGDITQPSKALSGSHALRASAKAGDVVHVADVEQLYAAVNDPANVGATLLLAPGTYVLSLKNAAGGARPNAGRLELQKDMSVIGVAGDRGAVVIDAAAAGS
ncbi:MAG TPA: hypothetical protein VM076_02870, partial [Gemmatimonadaceae bacterium]|nr:hypothetical protein [Gemmatimonadaceae bacterium]